MLEHIKTTLNHYISKPLGVQKQYAVLLPLIQVGNELHVVYQVRSKHISQPGEVSFPGGARESDESFLKTALRETCEELLLPESAIKIIGEIDYLVMGTREIHCFIGQLLVPSIEAIRPNEEVERLFTIPINALIEKPPHYYSLDSRVDIEQDFPFDRIPNGHNYPFSLSRRYVPFYDVHEETIWGLTAQLTHRFTQIIHPQ